MIQISPEELVEFVRVKGSFRLKTGKQKKPFTVRLNRNELEFMPHSTQKARAHEMRFLRRVCERFSKTNSYRPSDYGELTVNASYTLALIKAYRIDLPTEGTYEEQLAEKIKKSEKDSPEARQERLRDASKIPESRLATTRIYLRNADVIVEVRLRAKGVCEECGRQAPFKRKSDGEPYLEVHHKEPLAEGGEDTVENAFALCPNCHRKAHYG